MFTWLKRFLPNLGLGEASGVRARNKKGRFVADDPNTPNVNEAYVDGKRGRPRKNRK